MQKTLYSDLHPQLHSETLTQWIGDMFENGPGANYQIS